MGWTPGWSLIFDYKPVPSIHHKAIAPLSFYSHSSDRPPTPKAIAPPKKRSPLSPPPQAIAPLTLTQRPPLPNKRSPFIFLPKSKIRNPKLIRSPSKLHQQRWRSLPNGKSHGIIWVMQYRRAKAPGATYFFTVVTYQRQRLFDTPQVVKVRVNVLIRVIDLTPGSPQVQSRQQQRVTVEHPFPGILVNCHH